MTEKDLAISIKAAMAIHAKHDVLDALVQMAAIYIEGGLTQEGADVLAYVLRCNELPEDISDHAEELWDALEAWICPRVLLDAEDFGKKAYLEDVVEYVLVAVS